VQQQAQAPRDAIGIHTTLFAPARVTSRRLLDGGGGGHGREGNVAEVHLAEGEVEQRHAGGHAEDVVQGQAAAHRHCCRRVGGVVSWGEL